MHVDVGAQQGGFYEAERFLYDVVRLFDSITGPSPSPTPSPSISSSNLLSEPQDKEKAITTTESTGRGDPLMLAATKLYPTFLRSSSFLSLTDTTGGGVLPLSNDNMSPSSDSFRFLNVSITHAGVTARCSHCVCVAQVPTAQLRTARRNILFQLARLYLNHNRYVRVCLRA